MAIKKRNKIRLPSDPPEEIEGDTSVHRPIQQIKPGLLNTLEDDDGEICELQPIRFKKVPKRVITFGDEQEDDSHYNELYNSKKDNNAWKKDNDDVVILNMEDMMEGQHQLLSDPLENGDSLGDKHSIIPTREEIMKLKEQKSISRKNLSKSNVVKEKDYVKLLDSEDKRELMETIKSNGGLKRSNEKELENFSDDELQGFQDERLALTENQIAIQKDAKKKVIEEALGVTAYRVNEEWEAQLLSKGNVLKPNEAVITPLPILFPEDGENGNNMEEITDMVLNIRLQRKKVELRLQALQKAKMDLENSKANLISKLIDK
ncbi:hypothetical protein SEUBUCD646_0K02420 [Saccharomyces eubayanus]|uniref:Nineteen complex-protein n=2 Tax=Saccharomyces TaxID=4930 RepID=A0A6C1EAP9_SACPS|nr:nineteen complex- protein [Saccharomyces pastorianus]CAI1552231.1 hypothetical protein SEUBUCD650_0K02410 [Saccharomyces eubayanus]CAI1575637.1 hypothetical protein SEUBUCD646_0K02420 [Saccharomyces eubayanus]